MPAAHLLEMWDTGLTMSSAATSTLAANIRDRLRLTLELGR